MARPKPRTRDELITLLRSRLRIAEAQQGAAVDRVAEIRRALEIAESDAIFEPCDLERLEATDAWHLAH